MIIIRSLDDLLKLPAGTVLKFIGPNWRQDFRIIRQQRLDPYDNNEYGIPCDLEVSEHGVHGVGPIFQSDFDRGAIANVASVSEAKGKEFSYGNLDIYRHSPYFAFNPESQLLEEIPRCQ